MCGIVGVFDLKGKREIPKEIVEGMSKKLTHRGPDESGFYVEPGLAFGFKRLSIIDLDSGNQPHFSENRDIVSICNGEIYNYKELKSTLCKSGHAFETNSDIEVLPHLYEEFGFDVATKLNGQFAFAIYSKKDSSLMLCRDQVGIAPLFYTIFDGFLIFASEIKAILEYPNIKKKVNLNALDELFNFPSILAPNSMFEGIYALRAGHFLRVEYGEVREFEYWDLRYPKIGEIEYIKDEEEAKEAIVEELKRSVARRLQADVPIGFYLSGGLDSSLIGALIKNLTPNITRDSFSINFQDSLICESPYQEEMVKILGSRHHKKSFDAHEIASRLKSAIYYAESPLKESYNTCSLALSELVSSNNIKVILTGEGSDELFAGYVGYRVDSLRDEDDELSLEMAMEREIRGRVFGDESFKYEKNYLEFKEIKDAIYSKNLDINSFCALKNNYIKKDKISNLNPIHKRSYVDFKFRLSDHLLSDHGDRVSYANSIEARYPFLDIEFIELVKRVDPSLFIKNGVEKYILKEASKPYLPSSIYNREKFAFVAQGSNYLLSENIEWINDLISYDKIKREGYFDPDTVERIKKLYSSREFKINQTFDTDLLMIIITFEIFLETFI